MGMSKSSPKNSDLAEMFSRASRGPFVVSTGRANGHFLGRYGRRGGRIYCLAPGAAVWFLGERPAPVLDKPTAGNAASSQKKLADMQNPKSRLGLQARMRRDLAGMMDDGPLSRRK